MDFRTFSHVTYCYWHLAIWTTAERNCWSFVRGTQIGLSLCLEDTQHAHILSPHLFVFSLAVRTDKSSLFDEYADQAFLAYGIST
jgi:hypothetical protein